ncbi:hypothetical protein RV11_GL003164 [Enterococcus phoeniculicola]|nr:hypothetical protein RV11_GL003164 [Enterococcus phoeniculicola]
MKLIKGIKNIPESKEYSFDSGITSMAIPISSNHMRVKVSI